MPGHIGNAADGSAGVYTTQHIAQQFTYTLDASSNLAASSDYVAVLHFAGKPLASVPLITLCGSIACATVCKMKGHSRAIVTHGPPTACPFIIFRYRRRLGFHCTSKTAQVSVSEECADCLY